MSVSLLAGMAGLTVAAFAAYRLSLSRGRADRHTGTGCLCRACRQFGAHVQDALDATGPMPAMSGPPRWRRLKPMPAQHPDSRCQLTIAEEQAWIVLESGFSAEEEA